MPGIMSWSESVELRARAEASSRRRGSIRQPSRCAASIAQYAFAWDDHDLDSIVAVFAPDAARFDAMGEFAGIETISWHYEKRWR